MARVNQTRTHCVHQMGKTHSKPLAARHGKGTAWARHAMCESALRRLQAATRRGKAAFGNQCVAGLVLMIVDWIRVRGTNDCGLDPSASGQSFCEHDSELSLSIIT